jgi:hypothetical protein
MLKRLIAYVVSVLRNFFGRKPVEVLRHAKPREIILLPPKQQPFINNKVHPFDDLDNWGHDWTNKPPLAKHEIEDWQKRFDRAFGLNRNGKSCFKLVWNGDRSQWWKYAYDWDSYGKGIKWELRPRILWKKVELGNGDYVDLFPPRWLILMRIEPEQYGAQWKDESWIWDPKRRQRKQIRDDEVPKAFWETVMVIGEHDKFCCDAFDGECFGVFRNPNDTDLNWLHARKQEFEAGVQSPYENLNARTESQISSFVKDYYRQQYQKMPASTEIVIENAGEYLKPLMDFTGQKFSDREQKEIVKTALDRHYTEKAEHFEQQLRGK